MGALDQEGKARAGASEGDTTSDPKVTDYFSGFGCSGKDCVFLPLIFTQPDWCQRQVSIISN